MIGIYKITNKINNKIYIGQSVAIEQRWKEHQSCAFNPKNHLYNIRLYCAFRKYGIENFIFEIIELCDKNKLNERELYWIEYYNSTDNKIGYNIQPGGNNHSFLKLKNEEISDIENLLQNTKLSQQEIANKYNISQKTVSNINTGKYYENLNLSYPLRKKSILIDENAPTSSYKKCPKCGKIIKPSSNLCKDCFNLARRKVERPSREILKQKIKENTFAQIGREYLVDEKTITNWCKKYNLPYRKKDINKYSNEEWIKI